MEYEVVSAVKDDIGEPKPVKVRLVASPWGPSVQVFLGSNWTELIRLDYDGFISRSRNHKLSELGFKLTKENHIATRAELLAHK